jgi:hypothetical protein
MTGARRTAGRRILLGSAAVALLSGAWLEFQGWKRASLPFALMGVALLLLSPSIAVVASAIRSATVNEAGRLDAALLIDVVHRVDAALQTIRLARAHIGVAAASAFVLGLCQLLGLIDAWKFVLSLSLMSAAAAAIYLPWLARRERRAHRQRDCFRQRLGELSAREDWFAG